MQKKPYLPLIAIFLFISVSVANAYDDNDNYDNYDNYGDDRNYSEPTNHYQDYYHDADRSDNYYSDDDDQDYYSTKERRQAEREFYSPRERSAKYDTDPSRLPQRISPPGEKLIVVDPHVHAWGAYTPNGELLRSGIATSGKRWCPDIDRPCRTAVGSFRIFSLGSFNCVSHKFPVDRGGAPMPYCMFFNGGQGLHGSYEVVDGNASHGCVRLHVDDAEWLRFNFANIGTKVIVKPY